MVFNVLSKYGMNLVQGGGAKAVMASGNGMNALVLFSIALLALLLRAFIVQLAYNGVGPKLMENHGVDPTNFRPLTFMESILFVILIQNLFN